MNVLTWKNCRCQFFRWSNHWVKSGLTYPVVVLDLLPVPRLDRGPLRAQRAASRLHWRGNDTQPRHSCSLNVTFVFLSRHSGAYVLLRENVWLADVQKGWQFVYRHILTKLRYKNLNLLKFDRSSTGCDLTCAIFEDNAVLQWWLCHLRCKLILSEYLNTFRPHFLMVWSMVINWSYRKPYHRKKCVPIHWMQMYEYKSDFNPLGTHFGPVSIYCRNVRNAET